MIRRPPRSTRTDTLFPYTTLFRSTPVQRDEDYTGGIAVTLAGRRAKDSWLSLDGPLGWLDRLLLDDASNGTFQLHSIQVGALAFTPGNIKQDEEIGRASCRERVWQDG